MASFEVITNKILSSSWDLNDQGGALSLVPKLGKNSLAFLEEQVTSARPSVAPVIIGSLSDAVEAFDQIQTGGTAPFLELLKDAPEMQDYNFGLYILPFVLDVQMLIKLGRVSDAGVSKAVEMYLVRFAPNLQVIDFTVLVQNSLLKLREVWDLQKLFKVRYIKEGGEENVLWSQPYLQALEQNEQSIGVSDIIYEAQTFSPTVKHWIDAFVHFNSSLSTENDDLLLAQFLHQSPNLQKLTDTDRAALTDVLGIYVWLLHPVLTSNQIDVLTEEALMPKNLKPDIRPQVSRPIVDIDKKLEDLSERKEQNKI